MLSVHVQSYRKWSGDGVRYRGYIKKSALNSGLILPAHIGLAVSESAGHCNKNKWVEWRAGLSPCEGEGTAVTAWTEAADAPTPSPSVGHHSSVGSTINSENLHHMVTHISCLFLSGHWVHRASFRGNGSHILLRTGSTNICSNPRDNLSVSRTHCLRMGRRLKQYLISLWSVDEDRCNTMTTCFLCSLTAVTDVTTVATAATVERKAMTKYLCMIVMISLTCWAKAVHN